jgi:hypothetical protein
MIVRQKYDLCDIWQLNTVLSVKWFVLFEVIYNLADRTPEARGHRPAA